MKTLDREIEKFLPSSKMWLLRKGYITKSKEFGEYQWTEEGVKWINSLRAQATPKE